MSREDELPALAPEVEAYLTEGNVDDESRYMWRKYYSAWGTASVHLDGGNIVTPAALMMHARGEENARVSNARIEEREGRNKGRQSRAAREKFGAEWLAWQAQCTTRNAEIERLGAEWRKRIAERKANAMLWDTYVDESRAAYQAAKLTPVPTQPSK